MEADAVIIGAGVLGSSVALGLTQQSFGRVVVIDADLSGKLASSTLNVGGVRATWWWPINIELSLRSLEYFWTIRDEIGYKRSGYLWMYDEERWPRACEAISRQNEYGLGVEMLTPDDVMDRVKEMDCPAGMAGATFSPLDGLVDSVRIKQHYQRVAKAGGAEFFDRWFVTRIEQDGDGWIIRGKRIKDDSQIDDYLVDQPDDAEESLSIKSRVLINAAGPWATRIAALYGDKIPSAPQRRQVFYVKHPRLQFEGHGMIVDSSGAFIQPLGDELLCGFANPDEPMGYNFGWEGLPFYKKWVLPNLAQRFSSYNDAEMVGGWARLYENSPDHSGIIGKVEGKPGLYQLHSFSGHGVMQSYGAGQALTELITEGEYVNWPDAKMLSPDRFNKGELVIEKLYI